MKLEPFLQDRGVKYEKHYHPLSYTSQGLAHAEHISGYMVAKPVIVKTPNEFVMCVLPAPKQLDLTATAQALNVAEVRLATEEEMAKLFPECDLGAEPPVGSLFNMTTVMDDQLLEDQFLVMQAGTHTESVKLAREDFEKICVPTVAHVTTG